VITDFSIQKLLGKKFCFPATDGAFCFAVKAHGEPDSQAQCITPQVIAVGGEGGSHAGGRESVRPVLNRLRRAQGQLAAVITMIESGPTARTS
jgi:hypothetical protein